MADGLDIAIVSDREKGTTEARYFSLLPAWASRKLNYRSYLAYAFQNISYLGLFAIVFKCKPKTMLIHSAFFNNVSVFPLVYRGLRCAFKKTRFIADVRDRALPVRKLPILNEFDAVIACSRNVSTYLQNGAVRPALIKEIPVIQEKLEVSVTETERILSRYGLVGIEYIFYSGRVKTEKRVDLLLVAFLEHVLPRRLDCKLVIAGPLKTKDSQVLTSLQHDSVIYVGNVDRSEVLSLTEGASLCVNLCPDEGLPRSSLEALALKRPVILPPNVPEFQEHCSDWVEVSTDPIVVGQRMWDLLSAPEIANYPIKHHRFGAVRASYRSVLRV